MTFQCREIWGQNTSNTTTQLYRYKRISRRNVSSVRARILLLPSRNYFKTIIFQIKNYCTGLNQKHMLCFAYCPAIQICRREAAHGNSFENLLLCGAAQERAFLSIKYEAEVGQTLIPGTIKVAQIAEFQCGCPGLVEVCLTSENTPTNKNQKDFKKKYLLAGISPGSTLELTQLQR